MWVYAKYLNLYNTKTAQFIIQDVTESQAKQRKSSDRRLSNNGRRPSGQLSEIISDWPTLKPVPTKSKPVKVFTKQMFAL